ncbi:MAG: substrate-binding domain-containing protein [Spirochaetales bacterium]|nr:substrate-binding domain-containing protein [Spirochaetales bacterium]MCF7937888.1 substrate-binding domain-containing protein [Spirochaetales bacterium]
MLKSGFRKGILFTVVLFVLGGAAAFFFFTGTDSPDLPRESNPQLEILFMPGRDNPLYYSIYEGAQNASQERNINLSLAPFHDSWNSRSQTEQLVEYVNQTNPDCLIISPASSTELIKPLKTVFKAGTEVITVNTPLGDGNYSKESEWAFPITHIGSDNTLGGRKVAYYLSQITNKKGHISISTSKPDISAFESRVHGFYSGISGFPSMRVVSIDYNYLNRKQAFQQTISALQTYPSLSAIFGTDIVSSKGINEAIKSTGMTGVSKVLLWGALPQFVESIETGLADVVVAQKPYEMGYEAVKSAYTYLYEKNPVPKRIVTGITLITPDNLHDPSIKQCIYRESMP